MGLFKPWMSNSSFRAEKAIKNLTDQKKLAEAARKAPLETTRAAAVKRLTDQETIAKIAATDTSVCVRMAAIGACTDDIFLAQFACAINHEDLARMAVERIGSELILALVAESAERREVRVIAATKIESEALLVRVVAKMPEYGAWKVLDKIARFPDAAEQFKTLMVSAKDPKVRGDARIRYAESANDPNVLLACAREESGWTRRAMIKRIEDRASLESALLEDADASLRATILEYAREKLSEAALLSFALRTENGAFMRAEAARELLERDFFGNVAACAPVLNECLRENHKLIYLLAQNGDPRAIAPLEELALRREHGDKMTAPYALARIQSKEAVNALLRIMERDHTAAVHAQKALMQLYKGAKNIDVQNAIEAIHRRVYHTHTDVGEEGRSCHGDEPYVHFDLAV